MLNATQGANIKEAEKTAHLRSNCKVVGAVDSVCSRLFNLSNTLNEGIHKQKHIAKAEAQTLAIRTS